VTLFYFPEEQIINAHCHWKVRVEVRVISQPALRIKYAVNFEGPFVGSLKKKINRYTVCPSKRQEQNLFIITGQQFFSFRGTGRFTAANRS
jgi:hypothetical protein